MTGTSEIRGAENAHILALHVLMAMGWRYIPPGEALMRRDATGDVLLKDVLIEELRKRRFTRGGEMRPLSANAIDHVVRDLETPGMNDGLLTASQRIHDRLTLGVTAPEFVGGKKHQLTIPVIDWENIHNNRFHVTERMAVRSSNGVRTRHPDIVCFVNGLPLAVIDTGRPGSGRTGRDAIPGGIARQIRNQGNEEIPLLYAYAQLLLAVDRRSGRYGATKTSAPFWAGWREEDFDETLFIRIKNTPLSKTAGERLFANREPAEKDRFEEMWSGPLSPTDQDRLLISLLKPERLLEFVRFFILFDRKVGKVAARYPQAFGVKRLVARIREVGPDGGRKGGVIWHTSGSGKSFTMVFLCKALLLHEALKERRVIVVTDRIDLEKQLSGIFLSAGAFGVDAGFGKEGGRIRVRTGKELARRIGKGKDRLLFSIINKFNTASGLPECHNPSPDIIVLVDEGHRSHGGECHERMRRALPNAAFIAFTGTPLLKEDKTTNKFGPIVHAYTMRRAVEDGVVTPLLYEERRPVLGINEKAADHWFDEITRDLSEDRKANLRRKFAGKGAIHGADGRIELIARDIGAHFSRFVKSRGLGLKGQLAADSKRSAIRFKKHLDRIGLVTSAVVISPPGAHEGCGSVEESESPEAPEVMEWWRENVGGGKEEAYTRSVIHRFGSDGAPDILIVVDKLLTGFDEPRNTVLYIDKPLKRHNLIQAVARVNRLHEARRCGLLMDYRGILKELDASIKDYQDLETRVQGGYDVDDLDGLYHRISTEYKRLPMLRDRVFAVLGDAGAGKDARKCREFLRPKWREDEEGELYDVNQKTREDFREALVDFGACLELALGSRSFYEDGCFSEADIRKYKEDHRFFIELRRLVGRDAREAGSGGRLKREIHAYVDHYVEGREVMEPGAVYRVDELGNGEDVEAWSEEKTKAEADLIRTRLTRTIEHDIEDDPYARKMFSERLKEAVDEAEAMFDAPLKQYLLFKEFEEKVASRRIDRTPAALGRNRKARAYYGVFRLVLGDAAFEEMNASDRRVYIEEALAIEKVVSSAVAEHTLNPSNAESEIRKKLLPRLFQLLGMDRAREVIERIIRITRVAR